MASTTVTVPSTLLFNRSVVASAKLIWLTLRLGGAHSGDDAASSGVLCAKSGLARHTVLRALAQLESEGWLHNPPAPNDVRSAAYPAELLLDKRLGIQARLLYGVLQLTASFHNTTGRFTHRHLGELTGISPSTVKLAIKALQAKGWLQTSQTNRRSPIHFTLRNPAASRREGEVVASAQRLREARYLGEALMREYLSLIVTSDEYEDDASPGFLVNPYTGEEMQFDRYYPPRVAFEFNGPQHYGATAQYPDEQKFWRQQGRDYIKMGICQTRGIHLVLVHAEDLSLDGMRRKVGERLPLRRLDDHRPLVSHLEQVSRGYRRRAR